MPLAHGTRVWRSRRDFAACTGRGISVLEEAVRLRRGVTLADEMGNCSVNDREEVAGLRQARKSFFIPEMGASRALLCPYLLCDRADGELDVDVNGHSLRVVWPGERSYWEDRWHPLEIPSDWLSAGRNEVTFRAVADATWTLLIEESVQPKRSAVSEDGGLTWRSEEMGVNDRACGEYMVRLWLDQNAETGEVCSSAVDLLGLVATGGIAAAGRVDAIRMSADVRTPTGCSADLQWRGGPCPAYRPETWTAWAQASELIVPADPIRFLQWRIILQSEQPSKTPEVTGVSLSVTAGGVTQPAARIVDSDNPALIRSSYRFSHLPADSKRGKILRERWKLDEVIRPAKSEFKAFLHLRQWVREQWEDGWNMGEIEFCPPWDAMVILSLARRRLSLGMCTHYATVMSHCCAALGFTARTQIMRSHCINEVWSNQHGKWVAMDVGGDSNDETKFTYHLERQGAPLSALEAHRAWVEQDFADVKVVPEPPPAVAGRFQVAERLKLFERFMISLRNDELETMGPGEPEHGKISYHFNRYLYWEDADTPGLPWFSKHTERAGDLYWTPNRAEIHLRQGGEQEALYVLLDTETANLTGFEKRIDDGEWQDEPEAAFEWRLHPEVNRLSVRPVNAFGRRGVESSVAVRGDSADRSRSDGG